ncbi:MAG: M20/M25/M40 family metallo-hydrolase, partial [Actinomycetota bacterium]|nr:M20/M25/M40 family metallo-hydrolase [Actinomycetota bacterium]
MTDLDRKLVDAVTREVEARRDDAVRLLQELVRVPSTTGEEGAVQKKVEHAFRGRGLEVDVWEAKANEVEPYRDHVGGQETYENRPNVAGTRRGRGGGRSLLLNAHIDTVAPGEPGAWGHDPLGGEVVGDRLYGRGSCDMKGGLVTHLAAL